MSWLSNLFSRKPTTVLPWTGRVMSMTEFRADLGSWEDGVDETYAEVNEAWLPVYYAWYRDQLNRLGVGRWDPTWDCDNFTWLYVALLPVHLYSAQYSSVKPPKAQSLAVAEYRYRPNAGPAGHDIACVRTQNGLRFIEPQNGSILTLTQDELATRFRVIF